MSLGDAGTPIVLTANTILSGNTAGAITLGGTVNGGYSLTINTTGNTTFTLAVGNTTALTTLTTNASGTTYINGGAITTSSTQIYGDTVVLGADTTLTTTDSNITFGSTVDSDSADTKRDLTLTLGSGSATITGIVGTTSLADITLNSSATFNAAVTATNLTIAANKTATVKDDVTIASTIALSGSSTLEVINTSAMTIAGTITDTGSSNSITVNDNDANTAPNIVTFSGTVAADTLYIGTATTAGHAKFTGTTGPTITSITITGGNHANEDSTATFNYALTATDITLDDNTGDAYLIFAENNSVTIAGTIDGAADGEGTLQITGTLKTFSNNIGDTYRINVLDINAATSFSSSVATTTAAIDGTINTAASINVSLTSAINANITTSGSQTYTGAVTLNADVILTTTDNNISFGSTINSLDTTYRDLSLVTGSGNVSVTGIIGADDKLDVLTVNNTGTLTLSAATTVNTLTLTQTGGTTIGGTLTATTINLTDTTDATDITFNGNVSATTLNTTAKGYNVIFNGTTSSITNLVTFSNSGSVTFGNGTGDTTTFTGGVTATAPSQVNLAGTIQTTNNTMSLGDAGTPIVLTANPILSGNTAGAITLGGTVNGAYSLTVNTTGTTTLSGDIGGNTALTTLTTNTGGTTVISVDIETSSTQTYSGAVVLSADVTLTTTDSNITFAVTVDGDGTARDLTIDMDNSGVSADGTVQFANTVGGLNAISITGNLNLDAAISNTTSLEVSGTSNLGASVTTSSTQTYSGDVTISADISLNTSGGDVTFDGDINTTATSSSESGVLQFLGGGSYKYSTDNGSTYSTGTATSSATTLGTGSLTYSAGSYTWTTPDGASATKLLVVGGGGGGGYDGAGGGGAGGLIYDANYSISANTSYSVTVGAGGAKATSVGTRASNGTNSVFNDQTAIGGGGGGSKQSSGAPGGSGGGGGHHASNAYYGGSATLGQGNAGGRNSSQSGGGGGGAGGAGANASGSNGGNGGAGLSYDITGTTQYYAAGGAGGTYVGSGGTGGSSIGGDGCGGSACGLIDTSATANTGSGGGSNGNLGAGGTSGNGASGIVVVNYSYGSSSNAEHNLTINSGSGAVDINGAVANVGTLSITSTSAASEISGIISTDTIVTKAGSGTLTLSANNSYTGQTNINAGIISITHNNALGSADGATIVASGAALYISNNITIGESISIAGTGISSNGAIRNTADANTITGLITQTAHSEIQVDTGSSLTLNPTTGSAITGTYNLTIESVGTTTISDPIATSTGNLIKTGAGTLNLSGTNTYTGVTTISAGTIKLTGAVDAATDLIIASGATLDLQVTQTFASLDLDGTISNTAGTSTLTITGTSAIGGSITTSGTQDYEGAVTVTGNSTLTTTSAQITFDTTVNSETDETNNLTITASEVQFDGIVGGTRTLGAISITGSLDLNQAISNATSLSVSTTSNLGANVTTTGTQTYSDA